MLSIARGAAALALAALGLGAAEAATVTLTGWEYGNANFVHSAMYDGWAGGVTGALAGAGAGAFDAVPFVSYSVEPGEALAFGSRSGYDYEIVSGADYFGAAKADRLGRLMTWVGAHPAAVDSAVESTALQLAIWNIVEDGDWTVTSAAAFKDASVFSRDANALAAGGAGVGQSAYEVFVLQRAGSADLLLLQAVPEPASLALAAAALGALALTRRRARSA